MILIHSSLRFLRQNTFQIVLFLKLSNHRILMLGRVFWKSRKVISMGARWRVGDGRSIRIFFFFPESWIPGNLGRKVISPAVSLHRNSTVLNLIDLDSKWWKS